MLQLGSTTIRSRRRHRLSAITPTRISSGILATRVALDKRPDGSDAFSLLKWKPAAVQAGVKGGGFLMFQTVVTLPEATRIEDPGPHRLARRREARPGSRRRRSRPARCAASP